MARIHGCWKCKVAQFHRAEKGDERMALKIRTRAEDMPDGREPFILKKKEENETFSS
jgi:hypothetical protein